MLYCAKTNTADPRTGFISVGEILSDEQTAALGEEKLRELVERGVLEALGGGKAIPKPVPIRVETQIAEPEEEPEDMGQDDADDADDTLPTLDAEEVLSAPTTEKPKKRGGRKMQ